MKKIISALLIVSMLFALCAFGVNANTTPAVTVKVEGATTNDAALLSDGNRHSDATTLGDGMFVVTSGNAASPCTVELVLDLGSVKGVSGYYMDVFADESASAVIPTDVSLELSEDGKVYFPMYSTTGLAPKDPQDKTVRTYGNDFAKRGNINARYLKAVVTFTGAKLAVTELGVLDTVELYTGSFDDAHPYTMHATGTAPCIAVFDSTDCKDGPLDLKKNEAPHTFLNSYFAIATRDGDTDTYTMSLSDVNVWNNELKTSVHTIESYTLKENEILVAIVTDGSGKAEDNLAICKWAAAALGVGDKIILKDNKVQFVPKEYEAQSEPTYTPPVVGEKKSLWLTSIDGEFGEGCGVICTKEDGAGEWWNVFAFAPVEGLEDVYTLTAISLQGTGRTKLTVPEGGFLYALHKGNNWPQLAKDDPEHYAQDANKPNYDIAASAHLFEAFKGWKVGDMFLIENIDKIPAENEGKDYWLEGWKVDATVATYVPATGTKPEESGAESAESGAESAESGTKPAESGAESAESGTKPAESGAESTGTSSETSTAPTTPETGDAGVIMLVVMALVAAVGSAVVVKSRR